MNLKQTSPTVTKLRLLAGGILLLLVSVQSTRAALIKSAVTGFWGTAATWTGGVAPTAGDSVEIQAGNNVTIDSTSTGASVDLTVDVGGTLTMGSGTSGRTYTLTGNVTNNGLISGSTTVTTTGGHQFIFAGTTQTWVGSGNISGGRTGFTINSGVTLNIATTNGFILNNNVGSGRGVAVTVKGTLNLGTNTFNVNGTNTFTLSAGGKLETKNPVLLASSGTPALLVVNSTATLSPAGSLIFDGTTAQSAGSSLPATISGLTINNAAGLTLGSTATVTNLTLTSGVISGNVILAAGGSITGGGTGSYVKGTLQESLTTGSTGAYFPIGGSSSYAGVTLGGMSVTANGTLALSTTGGQHPQILSSTISSAQDVNRYWTVTKGGAFAVSTYDITLEFANGDLIGGATPATFVMGKYDVGPGWTYPVVSVASANSTKASAVTSGFSDFAVGNLPVVGIDHFTVTPSTTATTAGTVFTATVQAYNASNLAITDSSVDGTIIIMTSSGLAQFDSNGDGNFGDATKALTNGTFTINVRDPKVEGVTITASSGANNGTSSSISIGTGPAAQLQVLLPGETAAPGTIAGKSGVPLAETAGAGFNIIVNSVDAYWNVAAASDVVNISASGDANAILPANLTLSAGTATVALTNLIAGSGKSLTALDVSNGGIAANTSSSYAVLPAATTRMLLLVGGESPTFGFAPGKTGSPSIKSATVGYSVIVDALDAYYNLVTNSTDVAGVTSSVGGDTLPASAALIGGTKVFLLTNNTVGSVTLTVTNVTQGPLVAPGTSAVTVNINGTTTSVASSANPANEGSQITFTATVTGSGLKTGTVTFKNGASILGTGILSGNTATFATSGGAGTYAISAVYNGDLNNSGSASSALSQVIQVGNGVASPAQMEDGFDYSLITASMPIGNPVPGAGLWQCSSDTSANASVTGNILIMPGDLTSTTTPPLKLLPNQTTNVAAHLYVNKGATDREFLRSIGNAITNGSAYFSFLLNTSNNPTSSGAPMATMLASNVNNAPLGNDPITLYSRAGVDSTHLNLGIQRLGGAISWASASLADAASYLVVLKYTFGADCRLYINPTPGNAEPVADAVATSGAIAEPTNVGTILFYESGTPLPLSDGRFTYDVMRVDSSWYNVTPQVGASGLGATKLAFSPGSQILQVNQNSALMTVTLKNQSNATYSATSDVVVTLSSSSGGGTFLSSADGTTVISSVTISNGTSAATFYYKDSSSGSPNLIGASGLLTSASQGEVVTPNLSRLGHFTVTPSVSSTTAGTIFTATVQAYDTNNAAITDGAFDGAPVTLTSSGLAQFDANGDATYGDAIKTLVNGSFTINARDLKAETITITAGLGTNTATSSSVTIAAGTMARLQVLLPGETKVAGSLTGRTNTPIIQTAGIGFNATVQAVDAYWNSVSSGDTVHLTQSGDLSVMLPADTALINGAATLALTNFLTGVGQSLTVTDTANGGITADTSSSYTVVSGAAVRLLLVAPGESTTFGVPPGKSGTPSDQLQTGGFTVTVYALDAYYNFAQNNTDIVHISSTDGLATLPANSPLVGGIRNFTVINNTQGSVTETVSDISNVGVAAGFASLTVDPVQNFRSVQSGNWGDPTTWEYSSDGGITWNPAVTTPSSSLTAVVEITNGITVTVANSVTVNRTTVDAGATLAVPSGVTVTVVSGSGADLDVFGILNNAGAVTNITPATIKLESGAIYYHNQNGGSLVKAIWDVNSTCAVTGWTTTTAVSAATGLRQKFGNFTWNSPGQTATLSFGSSTPTNFAGNFNVVSTGSGVLALCLGATVNLDIGGDVNIAGGTLYGATTGGGTENVNIAGNLNVSGGVLNLEANLTGTEVVNWNLSGNINLTGGNLTAAETNVWPTLNFVKNGTQKLTVSGSGQIAAASTIDWSVTNNATLDLGTNVVQGAGLFEVLDGGGLVTTHPAGFKGNLLFPASNVALSTAGSYIYNGAIGQSGDTLLPATVSGLTVNNNQGLILNRAEVVTNLNLNSTTIAGNISMGAAGAFTITGSNAKFVGNVALNTASLVLVSSNNLPQLTVQTGTLTLAAGNVVLTVLGAPLPPGNYLLVDANAGGSIAGTPPSVATVNGSGLQPGLIGTPQIIAGKLFLNVVTFYAGFDSGAGFFGGENLILTNATGQNFYIWSSSNPSLTVSNWTLEGLMSELPLGTSGYSRYGFNVNPITSPTYYIIGTTNGGPYLISPVPVEVVTTDDYVSYTVTTATVSLNATGVLGLVPILSANPTLTGGAFGLQFSGPSGMNYSILASTNLTSWTVVGSGMFGSSPVNFTDTNATNYPNRFYRISLP